jgi:Asp-tRNA(Asn)/Glu-tRNA(Gln) amidotransferase A subunit family amidase
VPSSLCGAVGLKASRGRIPTGGDDSTLEQVSVVGPITRTVIDNAFMLTVVAGPDPYHMYSLQETGVDYVAALKGANVRGLRVAYSPDLGDGPIEPVVRDTVRAAAEAFGSDLGAHVDEVAIELPDPLDYFIGWWGPQSLLGHEQMLAEGLPMEVDEIHAPLLDAARAATAVDYARVQFQERERIHNAFAEIFIEHDLLLWPTTPMVAFPHPGPVGGPTEVAGQEVRFPPLQNQRYTEAISHAGFPAITVPAGFTPEGLPVGLQLVGRHRGERRLLEVAAAVEALLDAARRPPIAA